MDIIHGDVLEELVPIFEMVGCTNLLSQLSHDVVIYAILMEFFGDG